jgi:hypothetical protein
MEAPGICKKKLENQLGPVKSHPKTITQKRKLFQTPIKKTNHKPFNTLQREYH